MKSIFAFVLNLLHSIIHFIAETCGVRGPAAKCDQDQVVVSAPFDEKREESHSHRSQSRPHRRRRLSFTTKNATIEISESSTGSTSPNNDLEGSRDLPTQSDKTDANKE